MKDVSNPVPVAPLKIAPGGMIVLPGCYFFAHAFACGNLTWASAVLAQVKFFPGWKGTSMIEIALCDIEKYYGSNHVLQGITFQVRQGDRLGLLGKNGAGKTTVFRIIAGHEACDAGELHIRKGARVGMLEQFANFPASWTVADVLYSAFEDLLALRKRMVLLETRMAQESGPEKHIEEYGRLQQQYEAGDGYSVERNVEVICEGLRFSPEFLDQQFERLSGGEQTKAVLGRLLLREPDILLLDEPTNHLDVDAIEWLEGYLENYKGTVVVISHDRYFLDRVVNNIVEIVNGNAEFYQGSYSYFVTEKEARYSRQLEKYQQEQKKIRQLEQAAKRLHEWGRQVDNPGLHRQAFSIEKRIERMEKPEKPLQEKKINTSFAQLEFSGEDIVTVQDAVKNYGGKLVLDHVSFSIRRGERTALLGENGSGKSTLLRLITDDFCPDGGKVRLGSSVRYGYLPQVVDFPQNEGTILEKACSVLKVPEGEARRILARYRFPNESVFKSLNTLSGGEKSRLSLCFLMHNEINLLILDEPTNHLDIDSREWLETALEQFAGTILFVSHDRYFIAKFASQVLELSQGRVEQYAGGYEYYREKRRQITPVQKPGQTSENAKPARAKVLRKAPPAREAVQKAQVETAIRELEIVRQALESRLNQCGDNFAAVEELFQEKCAIDEKLEGIYQQWFDLEKE